MSRLHVSWQAACACAVLFSYSVVHAQTVASLTTNAVSALYKDPFGISSMIEARSSRISLPLAFDPGAAKPKWKTGIVATIFWVGEEPTKNNPVPNTRSSWDPAWLSSFGGYDDPEDRSNAYYGPSRFVPHQNPFYVALPYNDIVNSEQTKNEAAKVIPWFKNAFQRNGQSVCRDHWVAVRYQGRICYAQWSDCGPFNTTDANYVFGESRPRNTQNNGAGLDLSPAVRDFLGFRSGEKCDWRFVDLREIPEGPWKSWGANNPFTWEGFDVSHAPVTENYEVRHSANPAATATGDDPPSRKPAKALHVAASLTGSERLAELRRQRAAWFGDSPPAGKIARR